VYSGSCVKRMISLTGEISECSNVGIKIVASHLEMLEFSISVLFFGSVCECRSEVRTEISPENVVGSGNWIVYTFHFVPHCFNLISGPISDKWAFHEGKCQHNPQIGCVHDLMIVIERPIDVKFVQEVL